MKMSDNDFYAIENTVRIGGYPGAIASKHSFHGEAVNKMLELNGKIKIETSNTTGYGWTAVDATTYDGAEDSKCNVGVGNTEAEAIADLLWKEGIEE